MTGGEDDRECVARANARSTNYTCSTLVARTKPAHARMLVALTEQ
jgi:hypothetical protein